MGWLDSKKVFWISLFVFAVTQTFILSILLRVANSIELIHQQTTFSPDVFQGFFEIWGDEKKQLFLSHYYLDFIHPLVYFVLLGSSLKRLGVFSNFNWILTLPFLTAFFDELENIIQLPILLGWLSSRSWLFYIGALSSNLKWIFAILSLLFILIGIFKKNPNRNSRS